MSGMDADVTPELIEEIDFSEKFRGYDPDQVDRFLERVGATLVVLQQRVEELSVRAQRAEAEVATLRERPPAPAPSPAPSLVDSDDADVEQASRTLLLAKRTAEAAINEARDEAAALVAEARARAEAETNDATTEADRLIREAQAQREELLRVAREEADRETAHLREALLKEIGTLEGRKEGLLSDTAALESHVEHYRSRLEGVSAAIRSVLDDPDALSTPPHGVDPSPTSSAFYYTGSNPIVSSVETTTLASTEAVEVVVVDDNSDIPPPEFVTPDEVAPADPWAPGSWSEVSAVLDERESDGKLFDDGATGSESAFDEVFEPAPAAEESVSSVQPTARTSARASVDQPTEAYDLTSDRYLRDLDAAVNDDEPDDAMNAFFEAEPQSGRRFGRRR